MQTLYKAPEVTIISYEGLVLSPSSMGSGGGDPSPGINYGSESYPYPLIGGQWSPYISVGSSTWMKCTVAGSANIYLNVSRLTTVRIYVDNQTTAAQTLSVTSSSTAHFNLVASHTYYICFTISSNTTVRAMVEQNCDTNSNLAYREWRENAGSGYANVRYQIKQFITTDELPGVYTAMCSTTLANATMSFLLGDILMYEYEAECLAAGVVVSVAVFLISAIDLLWSCLDLIGRGNLAAAITNVAGGDFSTPVAISYYRDETIPSYWTYNVEPWTGATMSGCVGARGTFRNLDEYWFGD